MNHIYQLVILLAISIGLIYSTQYMGNKNKFKGLRDLTYAIGMAMAVSLLAVFFMKLGLRNDMAFWLTAIASYFLFILPTDIITQRLKKNRKKTN